MTVRDKSFVCEIFDEQSYRRIIRLYQLLAREDLMYRAGLRSVPLLEWQIAQKQYYESQLDAWECRIPLGDEA